MTAKESNRHIEKIVTQIVNQFDPEKVILFGSWAWGEPHENSDVDLLVVKETANTRHLARQIDGELFPRTVPLDIIVYRPQQLEERTAAGDNFAHDILKRGRVLYER